MNNPDKLIVRAHIPSLDNPDAHVLHFTGTLPSEVAPINHSVETVLHAIGGKALNQGYVSIDSQLKRQNVSIPHNNTVVNIADVLAKPIDRSNLSLSDDYRWSDEYHQGRAASNS